MSLTAPLKHLFWRWRVAAALAMGMTLIWAAWRIAASA